MNYGRITLAITAIVAAASLATVAFAVPQQVLAHRYNHHNNIVKVDQQINQANLCSGQPPERVATAATNATRSVIPVPEISTLCVNLGSNNADIGH